MTTRILPKAEWPRLVGTEAEQVWPVIPEASQIVVVEDGEKIVGCHLLIPYWHLECLWIDAKSRGNGGVARKLWRAVQNAAIALGAKSVLTAAIDDRVRGLLSHVGAVRLPGDHYVVPMRGGL